MNTKDRPGHGRRFTHWLLCAALATTCAAVADGDTAAPAAAPATTTATVRISDSQRPLPGAPPQGFFYNPVGGDCGVIGDADHDPEGMAGFSRGQPTGWRLEMIRVHGAWGFAGYWFSLVGPRTQCRTVNTQALYHPVIKPELQPRLTGIEVDVRQVVRRHDWSDPQLRVELKDYEKDGKEVTKFDHTWTRANGLGGAAPTTLRVSVDAARVGTVGMLVLIFDRADEGDAVEIGDIRFTVTVPKLKPGAEAQLFSLGLLLRNLDDVSGMMQDRVNFPIGVYENVTATAKMAKILAEAIRAGYVDEARARQMIVRTADLLLRMPRGPAMQNRLWPHYTRKGGTEILLASDSGSGSEWSSGDTAFALLDITTALAMIGDPDKQIPMVLAFARAIDWATLKTAEGGFGHGYDPAGNRLPGAWHGFGMETVGVLLCAKLAGVEGTMVPPPTDNGSAFILYAHYPLAFVGTDRWGNDWTRLRREDTALQVGWYGDPAHGNAWLALRGLFGLSAAECPAAWAKDAAAIYQGFGVGGRLARALYTDSAGRHVIVGHAPALMAAENRGAAEKAWRALRDAGLVSPLNCLESVAIDPARGPVEVNALQGSWNLALQTEGWFLADADAVAAVRRAIITVPALAEALRFYLPEK